MTFSEMNQILELIYDFQLHSSLKLQISAY